MKKFIIVTAILLTGVAASAQTATDTTLQNNLYEAGNGLKSSATFYRLGIASAIVAAALEVNAINNPSPSGSAPVVPIFLSVGSLVCFYIATVNLKYAGKSLIKASGKKK